MKKICILASGNGSNAINIIKYFQSNKNIKISIVASNNQEAKVLTKANLLKIETLYFSPEQLINGFMLEKLTSMNIDLIVLAGFMIKIPNSLISRFHNRIINIHPSLLPLHGGKGMYGINVHKSVLKSNSKYTGITIHFVNKNYDEGKIIFQAKCKIKPKTSIKDLIKQVKSLEHKFYPKIIHTLINENN